jgi:predicted nucleic acid-binding protein
MPTVLDASVAMAWCFSDETTEYAKRVLGALNDDSAVLPAIWPLEVANTLCVAVRRGRLEPAAEARFIALLRVLPLSIEGTDLDRVLVEVLRLAREQNLSSYDASYLELAMRQGLPLATADERLAQAARAAGVELVR